MNKNTLGDNARQHESEGNKLVQNGDLDGGLKQLYQALELYSNLNDKHRMISQLNLIGWIKRVQGELDKSLEIFRRQLDLSKELNDKRQLSFALKNISYAYYYKGDLVLAEEKAAECLKLDKEIKDKRGILQVNFITGYILSARGDYDLSLDHHTKIIDTLNENAILKDQIPHVYCLAHREIGSIFYFQRKIKKSIEYVRKALEIHTTKCEIKNTLFDFEIPLLYSILLASGLLIQDEKLVAESLEELSNFAKKWPWTEFFWKLGRASILASKQRLKYKMQAQQLYEEVLEKKFDAQMELDIQYKLCDLLLDELKYSGMEEILVEIQNLLKKISEAATKQRSISSLVILYYLQAKLSLVEGNAEFANELLTKGITLAKSKGIELYVEMLENLQNEIFIQLGEWKDLLTRNSRLQEKVELLNLKNDLTEAITDVLEKKFKTQLDPLKLEDEIPTLLLVLTKAGVQIYSHPFTDEAKFNDELLGSFLTAFDTFSDEAFSEGLDRAKFGEYTVVMEPIESFTVCYLFKGQPYVGRQKLIKFINGLQNNLPIMKILDQFNRSSQIIEINDSIALESLIGEIFIHS